MHRIAERFRERPLSSAVVLLLAVGLVGVPVSCVLTRRNRPATPEQFAAAGLAAPRTVWRGASDAEPSVERIRRALRDPRKVDRGLVATGGSEGTDEAPAVVAPREVENAAEPTGMALRDEAARVGRVRRSVSRADAEVDPGDADDAADLSVDEGGTGFAFGDEDDDADFDEEGDDDDDSGSDDGTPETTVRRLTSPSDARPRIGKILFQNERGAYESLVPRALRVQVFVDGPRARTVVDYVFSNPHDRRLQGTFYYPLPAGAAPAAFGMFPGTAQFAEEDFDEADLLPPLGDELPADLGSVTASLTSVAPSGSSSRVESDVRRVESWGEMQIARVVEQKRAREAYETIVRRNIDPALLEWSGANTFQARVFPIEGRSVKRVVLIYEETLPIDEGLLRYDFPLPRDERIGTVDARVWIDGRQLSLRAASTGDVRDPIDRDGWQRRDFALAAGRDDALALGFAANDLTSQVLEGPAADGLTGTSFFVRMTPDLPERTLKTPTGRAVFVVDTSLSEEDLRHGWSVDLMLEVLARDSGIDEYAVLLFDVRPRWLHDIAWRANSDTNRTETLTELRKVFLEGATHLDGMLAELDSQASWLFENGKPARVFLLSDGQVTWGQSRIDELLAGHPCVRAAPWTSYRFGKVPVNRELFAALSRASGGRSATVLSHDQIASAALAHRAAPVVLTRVAVEGGTAQDLVVAGDPQHLYKGQELEIAGRLSAADAGATLVVEADIDGETVRWEERLRGKGRSPLAWRAWAELFSRRLLAFDDERLDRMVVALSQRFALVNKVASLLILETEEDYREFSIRDETVDLDDLVALRTKEEDQRRDRLQGLAIDDVPDDGAELIRRLAAVPREALRARDAQPLVSRPYSGGIDRIRAEQGYREDRPKNSRSAALWDAIGRARALSGDTAGALRAYSSFVEVMPASAEAARLVGYACLALGQYDAATELFERVRLRRPFEPQSYLEEALALEAAGRWSEAARNYEILLARDFRRHTEECRTTATYHYARLLSFLAILELAGPDSLGVVLRRLEALNRSAPRPFDDVDFQLAMHWNTDSVDIDLWVIDSAGEKCYYEHKETKAGGKLYWDTTDGYGPELYHGGAAPEGGGTDQILANYYGNNSPRWNVPTAVLLVETLDASSDVETGRFRMILLPDAEAVLALDEVER